MTGAPGVKHLRVRGFKAVRFSAMLKALGLNILRAAAVMAAMAWLPPETDPNRRYRADFNNIKERFWATFCIIVRIFSCSPKVLAICPKLCL